jgi:hypothetical protein
VARRVDALGPRLAVATLTASATVAAKVPLPEFCRVLGYVRLTSNFECWKCKGARYHPKARRGECGREPLAHAGGRDGKAMVLVANSVETSDTPRLLRDVTPNPAGSESESEQAQSDDGVTT